MHTMTKVGIAAAVLAAAPLSASARSTYLSAFDTRYKTTGTALDTCNLCHPSGTSTFTGYANDLVAAGISTNAGAAFATVEPKDSDGDGYANLAEIQALSFPGDAKSVPATTPPPAGAPKIAVAPASLALGTVTVGASASQTTVVSNTGTADLTVSSVARCQGTSAEFTASPAGPFTVAAGGSQTVTVKYAPVDATTDTGCIAIANSDAAAGTVNVPVSGAGQAAPAAVLDVDISRFAVAKRVDLSRGGTIAPKIAVVNAGTVAGTATVQVEGAVGGVAVYTATQDVTLAPAAVAKISFPAYVPSAPGTIDWTVTVLDADPDTDVATATTKVVK